MKVRACADRLDLATLVGYWLAELAPTDEARIEAHLLGCAACSEELQRLVDFGGGIRALTGQGLVHAVVTSEFLERLAAQGLRLREYRLAPGGSVQCTVTPDDDLLVSRLTADFRGVQRVDLALCDAEGREEKRMNDIPVTEATQEVLFLPPTEEIRARPAHVARLRLLAIDPDGERPLGEYTFVHTPSSR